VRRIPDRPTLKSAPVPDTSSVTVNSPLGCSTEMISGLPEGFFTIPSATDPGSTHAVATLTAPILQLHDVTEPEPVGYGATYVANPPARIAVVGIGYADGYPRNLGNNGTAAVQGQRVPVVGRISMDLISIDVAALPREAVTVGDAVELIGPTIGVDEVATAAGTISYEILTGMGRRLVREYVEND